MPQGEVERRQCIGQLVGADPEEQLPDSVGGPDDTAPLLEGRSLAVRSCGLEATLGLPQVRSPGWGFVLLQLLHQEARRGWLPCMPSSVAASCRITD